MLRVFNRSQRLLHPLNNVTESCKPGRYEISTSTHLQNSDNSMGFFKTSETNPVNLNSTHLGRFYTISDEIYKKLYIPHHGFPLDFRKQCKIFREQCVLVRKPYLDLKRCVEAIDLEKPIVRFVIHGNEGAGKSMVFGSMIHYGYTKEFILVHFPWFDLWGRWFTELKPSVNRPGFYDHTVDAVTWLMHFKAQNTDLLHKLHLVTGQEYQWGKRESTPAGSSLLDLVEHGIARPGHATECIMALVKEIKEQSTQKKCKTMVMMDGVNGVFYECKHFSKEKVPGTRLSWRDKQTKIPTESVTMYYVFKDLFKPDWSGGVAIATVDRLCLEAKLRPDSSDLPRELLTKEGWELFDPFVPIEVTNYSSQEVQTTLDYYMERKWLAHPASKTEEGRLELEYLSTRNPKTLQILCNSR